MIVPPSSAMLAPSPTWWVGLVASYLLGALPFGLLLARVLKGVDLRAVGSGNIGATNALRVLGRPWGLVAFALDLAKGWVPVFLLAPALAGQVSGEFTRVLFGTGAVLGHCFPIYLGFRGGKGVATGCGAVVAVDPLVFLLSALLWVACLAVTRFVGLSSVLMGLAFPVWARIRHPMDVSFTVGCGLLGLLVVIRHRTNLSRMLAGTEPKIGRGTPKTEAPDG